MEKPTYNWPHAPPHRTIQKGTYMITGATYQKVHYFKEPVRLNFLNAQLIKLASKYNWELQAWAVFSNHYHFIASSPSDPSNLSAFISELHISAARYINQIDNTANRMVWWQFWDTFISYQYSYFARINYVI